jgi:lipopolysaccharide transport system ATP-binding protein
MSEVAIRVEKLGKQYQLGSSKAADLRNAFGDFISKFQRSNPKHSLLKPQINKNDFWALEDISFEVRRGEAIGIIGKNGAGKSTLLKILSRITEPTKGYFTLNGRVSSLLEVGTGFHMELTGRENIYLNGTILGMKRREIRQKFDEIVDFSGVEQFIDTPVKHYSSGMKVRLAFSVAAHLEPEILLIDEVLAVGDSEFQKKCLGKMEDVTGQGRTVLFVSHNMGAIQNLCSKAILLNKGQLEMHKSTEHVINRYLQKDAIKSSSERFSDRRGNGNVRISDLFFCDKNGNVIDDIISGQSLTIHLKYTSSFSEIKDVIIGLVITNSSGQFLTVLNNKMSNYNFEMLPGKGEIRCSLKKLPLMAGIHFLNINLYVNGINEDYVEAAKRFNVENADYYSSGFPNAYNRQGIYIDQEWMSY